MRRSSFFVIFMAVAVFCLEAYAFTVSYEQTTSGTGIDKPQKNSVKIKDDKIRLEVKSSRTKTITLIDGETMYSYIPSQNRAIKIVNKKARGMDVLSDYGAYLKSLDAEIVGSERVNGYDCDIYEFIDPRLNMTSKVWLWKEKGFPIKVETTVPGGAITTLMKNVKVGIDIDDSEFILPEGVEIIDMKEAMRE